MYFYLYSTVLIDDFHIFTLSALFIHILKPDFQGNGRLRLLGINMISAALNGISNPPQPSNVGIKYILVNNNPNKRPC